ncbi:MAG: cupin domain-containing protein [Cyanobacteria bacterium P01_H01_bin.58]
MLIRKLLDCELFTAGDNTQLRELLHPDKQSVDLRYSLAHAVVPVGKSSLDHALTTSEVYFILSGEGEMHIGDDCQRVGEGDAIYIPPEARQFIRNIGPEPLVFICIVDPAWQAAHEMVYDAE